MADLGLPLLPMTPLKPRWINRLAASAGFQAWAARFPLTRRFVRSEGQAMFDLVAGFCHSQVLLALVELEIPAQLLTRETGAEPLAHTARMPPDRMRVLLNAGVAIGILRLRRGVYGVTARGAALTAVPGLQGMILHHRTLYRDLENPVAFFRGETETELAAFWPYVFGAGAAADPATAHTYSQLMADSQTLVAADTLAVVSLSGTTHLMDVGGGTGAFLAAVGTACPTLKLTLFDLPAVVSVAQARFEAAGMRDRLILHPGSFRDDPLPSGADAISLIRVLYDHAESTVTALLRAVHTALPPGGRLLISEPMTGGDRPERAGDAYYALYCMAMRTGQARSAAQIAGLLQDAGFTAIRAHRSCRPFVTSVITAVRPA